MLFATAFAIGSFPVAAQDAVCAEVKIEIKQKVSLERQAFDAVLKINNGLTDQSIDNLQVTVNFTDAAGNSVVGTSDANNTTATFFIRVDQLTRVNAIDGSGSVAAKSSAEVRWLIIPSAGAGGTQPSGKRYSVGATISYKLSNASQTVNVTPEVITVKPQPRLALDYFLQQDIYADDPFTSAVEPSEPATLGVRIRNTGGGASVATKIETAQPKIVENRQGLLIAFQLINGYINDLPSGKTLLLDFGTIESGTAKVGRWDLVTTLAGRFTEFSADFTHSDSLGGALTSLIDSVTTRFLLKDVKVDLPGRDSVRDFLSVDGGLKVYESDGVDTPVIDVSGNAAIANVGGFSRLTHTSSSVLTYAKVTDPNGGTVPLTSVTRSDGKQLDAANYWLSKKRNADLTWSYFVNIFDSNSTGSYTLGVSGGTTATLAGTVYDDQNKNGVRDAGEPGIGTTRIDLAGTESSTGSSVAAIAYADASGAFSFASVKPGNYSLTVGATAARVDGVAALGNAGGTVVVGTTAMAAAITNIVLTAGASASGYLFAKVTPSTQPLPSADLSISVTPVSVIMNDQAASTLTYTVRNIGPDSASAVAVALSPSSTLRVNSALPSSGSFDSTSKRWTIGNLAKDGTATLSLVVGATGSGSGSVSAAVSGSTQDPISGNNSASTTFSVASTTPKADVRLISFSPSLQAPVGKPATIVFNAYNDGPDTAQAVGIDLALPTQFTVTSIQPVGSSSGSFDSATRRWTLPSLANGAAARLIVEGGFATNATNASDALFSAAITVSTSEDSNVSNNVTSVTLNGTGRQADLRTTVTSVAGSPLSLATTDQGTVVFTVTNAGPEALSAADATTLALTVPSALTVVSASADRGTYDGVARTFNVPALAVNESANLTLVIAPTIAATPMPLTAAASSIVTDPSGSSNVARIVINGAAVDADMRLSQTVDKTLVQVGDDVVFRLQLANLGGAVATDINLRDRLPAGLTFVSASTNPATGAGSYDAVTGTWALSSLAKDAVAVLSIRATVSTAGAFTNAASVTSLQPDSNVSNNTAIVTVTTNALPTVSITSPASGLVINAPAGLTLIAVASDPDGSIAKVEFFNGATLLGVGTLNAGVYGFAWANAPAATYSVTAKATDNTGAVSMSAPVTIVVNASPNVLITAPLAGASFTAPAAVNLMASAADSDGTIATVEFFNGASSIGLATRAGNDYALVWTTVAAGSYSVTAKATDDRGAVAISPPLTIIVQPPANQAPTVSITSPANNSIVNAPGTFVLAATASDVDGTISKVEFYNGATLLGAATLTSGSFVYNWTNVLAGTYTNITAIATDDKGATTTSLPLTLIVNALPTVIVTAPAANASFTAPASILLEATASDGDGSISKVEFLNGATLIGAATLSAGSYRYLWSNVPSGNYSLVAVATDDRAARSTSVAVAISVQTPANQPPVVAFIAPANNVVVNAPANVALIASAADSDGSVTKVEFFNGSTLLGVGTLATGNYVYNWANIAAGTYSNITAKATDDKGATATTAPITLVVNAMPTVSITAPATGATFTAPASVGLVASAIDSDGTISKVEFFNGATLLGAATLSGSSYTYNWTGVAVGSYSITAIATDNRGATTTSIALTVIVSAATNQPPTVTLVSPANNALVNAPGTFALTATASDSDGTVTKVEFFSGAVLLGQGTLIAGNYVFNWTNISAGTYANVAAKATDDKGATSSTPVISLVVNALPVVTLTAPTASATFVAPAIINLTATATDADGSVSKVEFFNGATLIGLGALSGGSYRYSWTNVPVGAYAITARVTDDRNATATSNSVSITVSSAANQPPTVAFTAPANNTVVTAPGSFALTATAADADGAVSKVEFFNGATLLGTGTLSSGSYIYNWTGIPAGTYSNVTAKATDDKGATATTAAISLIVNAPPTVTLTAPASGASFTAPATVGLAASASDSDGTISKVEFFNGATLLGAGTLTGVSYTYSWAGVPVGSYAITARATDNRGATSSTAALAVVVSAAINKPPTIAFTAPANNTVVTAPGSFALTAAAADTDGTIGKVEFFNGSTLLGLGTLSSGSYVYNWANVAAGTYSGITAKATDDKGATATTPAVTLIVNAPPTVTLTAPLANASFTAPAAVALSATATDADGSIAKLEFYNGTALLGVGTLASGTYSFNWSNVPAGTYAITAKATDNRGAATSTPVRTVTVTSCGTVSAFSFTSLDNVDLAVQVVSNPITVSGITCPTPISISGGDYNINGGVFVSTIGSVKIGDVVRVRVTSAPDYLQSRSALLTIGGFTSNFAVTTVAKPTIAQSQLRENRVLVFVACGATDNTNAQCLTARRTYVTQHLAGLGVESFVTSDATEFERELRCGKYNTYWISGGFEKLSGLIDDELAEAVYRGDGLLVDGVQPLRSDRIDLASGITYQGNLAAANLAVFNTGVALDSGNYATVGSAAKMVLAGAQQQASFETANATSTAKVAIATATYGAGKTITFGFDWVASAQSATATPLLRADIAKGLGFVLPALSDVQAAGSVVKVRTTVNNPAQIASTIEVAATLPPAGQFVSSSPVPISVAGNIVKWRVDVSAQTSTKIDWSVRAPAVDSTTPISSTLSRVAGTGALATTTLVGSASTALIVGSYTTRSNAVRAQIAALALTLLAEKTARDAVLADIDQAADQHARGKYDGGIRALIAANDSLDKITSVSTAVMQLQISGMLKALSQEACANGVNPSSCSATATFTNVSDFDYDGNDGSNVKLIRVRGGGAGSPTTGFGAGTWQAASLLKTASTQSQSTASFSYVSGRSYNWTFDYKGNGSVTLTLVDPTRQTVSISTGSNWRVGNAIKLAVHADAGVGVSTMVESALLALNGTSLSGGLIATTGNNLISDVSKVLSGPALTAPFKLTGTLKMTFAGSAPPTGDKLFFQITGGDGECE